MLIILILINIIIIMSYACTLFVIEKYEQSLCNNEIWEVNVISKAKHIMSYGEDVISFKHTLHATHTYYPCKQYNRQVNYA